MSSWVFVAVQTPAGSVPEARWDGVFDTWSAGWESLVAAITDLGVDPWRASSPQNAGALERVWWMGPVDSGRQAGFWQAATPGPDGARVITRMQLAPDHLNT